MLANDRAVTFWGEANRDDLLERRFAADDAIARSMSAGGTFELPGGVAEANAFAMADGRPGMIVMATQKEDRQRPQGDPLFSAAPAALAQFDAQGARLKANIEADELLMPGELGIVFSSPFVAGDFIADAMARGVLARTLPVATRFGMRRCRVIARRLDDGPAPTLVLAFDDVEDKLAAPAPAPICAEPPPAEIAPPSPPPAPQPSAVSPSAALEEVVAAMSDAALAADSGGRVIAMNARASQLLGECASGEHMLNVLPVELKADAAAYIASEDLKGLERALEDGRETIVRRGDLATPARFSFARLATGEILVQIADLTAVRAARDALQAAREDAEAAAQRKTDFIAGISHELRTPLSAIIGFAEIMENGRFGALENERYRGYVKDIREGGELLLSLINDLLDLSKAESGRIELEPDAVEIKPIITSVLSLLQPQAEKYQIHLSAAVADDAPAIVADARSLKQILINLAGNAIKFNQPGGEVEVSATMDAAGAMRISVRDDGPGMDAGDAARAMEPYRRTRSGRHREGTGLGLPLARTLIEANKAQFVMESAPGAGTVMSIVFPSALVLAG